LTESRSYAYYEYLDNIADRLSYGENQPERKAFYKLLAEACQQRGHDLKSLDELANIFEDKLKPAKDCPDEEFPYLGLDGIEPNTGRATFTKMLGKDVVSVSKRFYRGNIVFADLRPYLNKVHLVQIETGIGSGELFTIKPKEELVISGYLLRYLLSNLTLAQTKWILTGCSFPRLNSEDFRHLKVVCPDKVKQKQVLDRIEPLEAEVQQKRKDINQLIDNCRNLILKKLNIKMPSPAIFLPTIYDFYLDWVERNAERLDFVFHHPWMDEIRKLLASIKTVSLGELIEPQIEYGITESGREIGNTPFINIGNLCLDGRLRTKDIGYIDYEEDSKLVHQGDILMSRSRLVGISSLVSEKEDGYSFGSYILRLRVKKEIGVPSVYIVNFLNSDLGQGQVRMLESGAFGKNINTKQVKAIRIPLTQPDEIDNIVNEIRQTWDKLDEQDKEEETIENRAREEFAKMLLGIGSFWS
jgi:restriction endonuclease S subunit